jgi:hypothetical protein
VRRQGEAKAEDRHGPILFLASPLPGMGLNARGFVHERDFGFHFVAVLAAWALGFAACEGALLEQHLSRQRCRVGRWEVDGGGRGAHDVSTLA